MIEFEGHRTTPRTRDMLVELRRLTGLDLVITQGGYNAGGVAASAGTHDRDALDLRARGLTPAERARVLLNGRWVGFAIWYRTTAQGFDVEHFHAIPVGGDISAGAQRQVSDYMAGRNGLASKGKDDGPRNWVGMTWERYEEENGMSAEDANRVIAQVNAVSGHLQKNAAQHHKTLRAEVAEMIKLAVSGQTEQLTTYMRQLDAANDAEIAEIQAALEKQENEDGQAG